MLPRMESGRTKEARPSRPLQDWSRQLLLAGQGPADLRDIDPILLPLTRDLPRVRIVRIARVVHERARWTG